MADIIFKLNDYLTQLIKYAPEYVDKLIEVESPMFELMRRQTNSEYDFDVVQKVSGGSGFSGFNTDNPAMTLPKVQTEGQVVYMKDTLREFVSTKRVTLKAVEASQNEDKYIVDIAKTIYDDVARSMASGTSRYFYSPFPEGYIAAATGDLDPGGKGPYDPLGDPDAKTFQWKLDSPIGASLLRIGDIVDIYLYDATATPPETFISTAFVLDISDDWKVVTLYTPDGSIADFVDATSYRFYFYNTHGIGVVNYGLIATDKPAYTLHGLPKTNRFARGIMVNGNTSPLTLALLRQAVDKPLYNVIKYPMKYDRAFTTKAQVDNLIDNLLTMDEIQITYQLGSDPDLVYGNYTITVDGIKVTVDPTMPPSYCYIPEFSYLTYRSSGAPDWVRPYGGNGVLVPVEVDRFHVLRATMLHKLQNTDSYPNSAIMIYGLTNDYIKYQAGEAGIIPPSSPPPPSP